MTPKIAFIAQENFKTGTVVTLLRAIVFKRDTTSWNEMDELYVNIMPNSDINAVRRENFYFSSCQAGGRGF